MEEVSSRSISAAYEKLGLRIVALLVLLELLSVYFLWILNPVGSGAEATFAGYLAATLVAFAMISYVVRSIMRRDRFGRIPVIVGGILIVILLFVGLAM
jgi:hypothetical protein